MSENEKMPKVTFIPPDPQKAKEYAEFLEKQREESWARLHEAMAPLSEIHQAICDLSPEEKSEIMNYIDYIKYKRKK